MERHSELQPRIEGLEPLLVVRRSGQATPFNASDALAIVCEMYPGGLTSSQRGRLGKAAKELLEGGFEQRTVCSALYLAICTGRIHLAESIALDLQNVGLGVLKTMPQYREGLAQLARSSNPDTRRIRDALRKRRKP